MVVIDNNRKSQRELRENKDETSTGFVFGTNRMKRYKEGLQNIKR
jgi:hypothetical protein